MDPLAHLPRAPLDHISPVHNNELTIKTDSDIVEKQECPADSAPAHTAFHIWSLDDCLEGCCSDWSIVADTLADTDALDELEASTDYLDACNPPPSLHITIGKGFLKDWRWATN